MSKNTPAVTSMRLGVITLAAILTFIPRAMAATFTSEAHDHTVEVFSSSEKVEFCAIAQSFSYTYEGDRITTSVTCKKKVTPGDHVRICGVTHDQIVDPRVEGPAKVTCSDSPPPREK